MIDDLVQFEEDFNSRKTSSENSQKTSENSWEHRKTPKIIWYHSEYNWGPLIDNLVQFEEDFNSRTEKLRWGGPVRSSYLRPVQFLDHLTVIKKITLFQTLNMTFPLALLYSTSVTFVGSRHTCWLFFLIRSESLYKLACLGVLISVGN